ncbi:MAG: pseudouridine synthase [Actinomycetota bacterium]|nr:pseudouridine synthase [Actinomycetota bacterium]
MRIARFLSNSGVASRRKSELLVLEGKIRVNGIVVKDLSTKIDPSKDKVKFLDEEIAISEKIYIALNKPEGYLSTVKDSFKRKTVLDLVKGFKNNIRLFPVGRLDLNSRGLILLTNDGDFALKITHPRYMITKTYEIVLNKPLESTDSKKIINGVKIGNQKIIVSRLIKQTLKEKTEKIEITIHEGRKRILRRLFNYLGYKVTDLKRIKIGELDLKDIKEGSYRILGDEDINNIFQKNKNT